MWIPIRIRGSSTIKYRTRRPIEAIFPFGSGSSTVDPSRYGSPDGPLGNPCRHQTVTEKNHSQSSYIFTSKYCTAREVPPCMSLISHQINFSAVFLPSQESWSGICRGGFSPLPPLQQSNQMDSNNRNVSPRLGVIHKCGGYGEQYQTLCEASSEVLKIYQTRYFAFLQMPSRTVRLFKQGVPPDGNIRWDMSSASNPRCSMHTAY